MQLNLSLLINLCYNLEINYKKTPSEIVALTKKNIFLQFFGPPKDTYKCVNQKKERKKTF